MNDLQLFYYYQTIPLTTVHKKYLGFTQSMLLSLDVQYRIHILIGHYSFEEFLDKLYSDSEFKKEIIIMKLWKVSIKTYYFGNYYYVLFVLANDEENMKQTVRNHPRYKRDEDAEIDSYEEIDLEKSNK